MKRQNAFALPIVLALLLVSMILTAAMLHWVKNDTIASVKELKSQTAYNLAEAAVERGLWKVKSSTASCNAATSGVVIPGYNFDTTYADITGGTYRIKLTAGPGYKQITVTGEGRDKGVKEARAISAVFKNLSIPGPLLTQGNVTLQNLFQIHWGPVMSQGNITINDATDATQYFPRKYSKQTVSSSIVGQSRDTNGINPPNTDNVEWWSNYDVPELPLLDFATLRTSATADGTALNTTLNVFGCSKMTAGVVGAAWWGGNVCSIAGANHNGLKHFQNSWNNPKARLNKTWYWDNDVIMTGSTGATGNGMWGSIIIRGNFTNWAGDNYSFTGPVPAEAWREYTKFTKTTGDTATSNQYPADTGLKSNAATFGFGTQTWTTAGSFIPASGNTDVGFRGLIYVGGNMDMQGPADICGAVWVVGGITRGAAIVDPVLVFYDESLDLPLLNVILVRQTWDEVKPSTTTWAP